MNLAGNANRANAKRIYFSEKGLDICRAEDYQKGLETFRSEVFGRIKEFHAKQKEAGLYIKIDFQLNDQAPCGYGSGTIPP